MKKNFKNISELDKKLVFFERKYFFYKKNYSKLSKLKKLEIFENCKKFMGIAKKNEDWRYLNIVLKLNDFLKYKAIDKEINNFIKKYRRKL